jgi:hypothetical protein
VVRGYANHDLAAYHVAANADLAIVPAGSRDSCDLPEKAGRVNIIGRRRVMTGRRIISVDIVEFAVSAVSAPLGGALG